MSGPLIFYGYSPLKRRWECQKSVDSMERLEQRGYTVLWHPCLEPNDYAKGLRSVWNHHGPLVIVEHDMVIPPERLEALLACEHPICAYAYWIALGVAGRRPMLSACVERDGETLGGHTRVLEGDNQAGYSAIGCCKLDAHTRRAMGQPAEVTWTDVEHEVNRAVSIAGNWHIHWPVIEHHHGFMENDNARQVITQGYRFGTDPRQYRIGEGPTPDAAFDPTTPLAH